METTENNIDSYALYMFLFLSLLSVGNDFYFIYLEMLENEFIKKKINKLNDYYTLFSNLMCNNVKNVKNKLICNDKSNKQTNDKSNDNLNDQMNNKSKNKTKEKSEKSKDKSDKSDKSEKSKDKSEKSKDKTEKSKDKTEKSKDKTEKTKDKTEKSKDKTEKSKDKSKINKKNNENKIMDEKIDNNYENNINIMKIIVKKNENDKR